MNSNNKIDLCYVFEAPFYQSILIYDHAVSCHFFAQTFDQDLKLMIRAIGDTYLLQSKDSTTLILPVSKTPQGYVMQIDQPFYFSQMF